jgi:hypothetical protein
MVTNDNGSDGDDSYASVHGDNKMLMLFLPWNDVFLFFFHIEVPLERKSSIESSRNAHERGDEGTVYNFTGWWWYFV